MQIQNSSTIREIRNAAGLSLSEGFPQTLRNDVQAVIEINPKSLRVANRVIDDVRTISGNATSITFSSSKDTFITSIAYSYSKNALCDVGDGSTAISIVASNVTTKVCTIAMTALTAQSGSVVHTFATPLKVDRSSPLSFAGSSTFTVGNLTRCYTVTFYEIEPFENNG